MQGDGGQEPAAQCGAGAQAVKWSWRFRVPDGEVVRFTDQCMGPQVSF